MYRFALLLLLTFVLSGCSGSTSFLGEDFPNITLIPGVSDTVLLQLEAEGSHKGEYEITASVQTGDGLLATVDPNLIDVDGVVDISVTVTAAEDAPAGSGVVYVEATNGNNGAGTSISVTVEDSTQ